MELVPQEALPPKPFIVSSRVLEYGTRAKVGNGRETVPAAAEATSALGTLPFFSRLHRLGLPAAWKLLGEEKQPQRSHDPSARMRRRHHTRGLLHLQSQTPVTLLPPAVHTFSIQGLLASAFLQECLKISTTVFPRPLLRPGENMSGPLCLSQLPRASPAGICRPTLRHLKLVGVRSSNIARGVQAYRIQKNPGKKRYPEEVGSLSLPCHRGVKAHPKMIFLVSGSIYI
nr:uncharacterized protein LOC116153410 isoform X2 [Camelus dromedarius]